MITKSSGFATLFVEAFTFPLTLALTDLVKSREPSALGLISPLTSEPIVPSLTVIVKSPPALNNTFSTPVLSKLPLSTVTVIFLPALTLLLVFKCPTTTSPPPF